MRFYWHVIEIYYQNRFLGGKVWIHIFQAMMDESAFAIIAVSFCLVNPLCARLAHLSLSSFSLIFFGVGLHECWRSTTPFYFSAGLLSIIITTANHHGWHIWTEASSTSRNHLQIVEESFGFVSHRGRKMHAKSVFIFFREKSRRLFF